MFSEYILKRQILLQKFGYLLWKTELAKRVSQIMAGVNIVTFGGLTKHILMISGIFFNNLYDDEQDDFGSDNEERENKNDD